MSDEPNRSERRVRGTRAPDDPLVTEQQVLHLRMAGLRPVLINSALAILVVFVFRDLVAASAAIFWLAVNLGFNGLRVFISRSNTPAPRSGRDELARYRDFALAAGVIWGSGSLIFFAPDHIEYQVFLAFVLGGTSAGASSAYAAHLPAFYAFIVPALTPATVLFFWAGTEISVVMGLMMTLFGTFLASMARSFHNTIRNAISLQLARERIDRERRTSEQFFARAFHSSPALVAVSDPHTSVLYDVNQTLLDLSGYTRDELIGKRVVDIGLWADPKDRANFVGGLLKHGSLRGIEVKLRAKNGELFDLLASGDLIESSGGPRFLFLGQDITHLKEVARLKTDFVSVVSHELRTPLTSIYGSLKLLLSGTFPDNSERPRALLSLALKNAERLNALVNDILDLDKLQSGKMIFRFARVDLSAIAGDAVEQMRPFADEFGVKVSFAKPDAPAFVDGDEARLVQVMANILSNAAKFSPRGSEVDVRISTRDGMARVDISDRGPGVPEDFRARIFDRFSQADSSTTRTVGGSGLGLNICKAIVDAHRGVIDYVPRNGGGTTFYFEHPLAET